MKVECKSSCEYVVMGDISRIHRRLQAAVVAMWSVSFYGVWCNETNARTRHATIRRWKVRERESETRRENDTLSCGRPATRTTTTTTTTTTTINSRSFVTHLHQPRTAGTHVRNSGRLDPFPSFILAAAAAQSSRRLGRPSGHIPTANSRPTVKPIFDSDRLLLCSL